jgi:hypothetical protein
MKNEKTKEIIIGLLQSALTNKLKIDSHVNPQHIADAIIQKTQFETSFNGNLKKEVLETVINNITECKDELDKEYDNLDIEKEKLLRNFVRGKSTAYEEILDILNKII